MSSEPELHRLVEEIRHASNALAQGDARVDKRIDAIEGSVNELYKKVHGESPLPARRDEVPAARGLRDRRGAGDPLNLARLALERVACSPQPQPQTAAAQFRLSTRPRRDYHSRRGRWRFWSSLDRA